MTTDAISKKKPLTHCEKYGHTWASSTSEGFELCTHVFYDKQGKSHPCGATRRTLDHASSSQHVKRPVAQPSYSVHSVQQVSLFE